MLEAVPVLEKDLALYGVCAGVEAVEKLRALADPLAGARILHINSTAVGGGVAEHLATHVPLLRSAGIDAHWQVIHGSEAFFSATKQIHNALQGMEVVVTPEMERLCLDELRDNARRIEGPWDIIVVHDPQPAALLPLLAADDRRPGACWVWRCHIDLATPRPETVAFLLPFVEAYDATIWTMEAFVPDWPNLNGVEVFTPTIDPLVPKNLDVENRFSEAVCRRYGVDPTRPILCQVSRFDPWKDPVGVIEAYRMVRQEVPDAQLVLVGSMASDDPEAARYWALTRQAAAAIPGIQLLPGVPDLAINAFQSVAEVVVQKSLREGFGLTVSEALWKRTPVIGGRAGGITVQIEDGVCGHLVDSIEQCAERATALLRDPDLAVEMGKRGRRRVRERFLSTRELGDYLQLFNRLLGTTPSRNGAPSPTRNGVTSLSPR